MLSHHGHPERSQLLGGRRAQCASTACPELPAHCTTAFHGLLRIVLQHFSEKMTIPLKSGTSPQGTLWCDPTAPKPQLVFPQGANISAPKCCWRQAIICTVIKLNPLLGLALSLNNTSIWVIHSQGTNTSPRRSLSMMYWRNTSECTPAIRIYGIIHHQGEAGWWCMALNMVPCSNGLGQDQEDKGWHHCYLISQCYSAGTESAFLNQRLTLTPYFFNPRHCIAESTSSQMNHSHNGPWG